MDSPGPNILSLCTGIGGIELGIKLVMPGARMVCACERESFAASDLLARMEEEALEPCPIWGGDLADFDGSPWAGAVDIVTAGIPCQPWSRAGKRRGTADNRWLWRDVFRVVCEVGPQMVFLENVPDLVRGGIEWILRDLAVFGFDAEWDLFSAAETGAPHRRERLFLLAYTEGFRHERTRLARGWRTGPENEDPNVDDPDGPRESQPTRTVAHVGGRAGDTGSELADRDGPGLEGRPQRPEIGTGWPAPWPPGPGGNWGEILEQDRTIAPAIEPSVLRMADGVPEELDRPDRFRTERIHCLGNAVVPVVAATAFLELWSKINGNQQHY